MTTMSKILDLSIDALNYEIVEQASSACPIWWGSPEYCYLFPNIAFKPQRVLFIYNEDRNFKCGYCYRYSKGRFFKTIQVLGPLQASLEGIDVLLQRSHIIIVRFARFSDIQNLKQRYPQCWISQCGADIVLNLPKSIDEYIERLGKKTKRNLKYYIKKIIKEWGEEFKVVHLYGTEITEDIVSKIVEFNSTRLYLKGKNTTWTQDTILKTVKISQKKGIMTLLLKGTDLLAGALSFKHFDDAYFILIGHDNYYDYLNLGKVVCYYHIEVLINENFKRLYMHYGQNPYKVYMGGQQEPVYNVVIFRNKFIQLLMTIRRIIYQKLVKREIS